MVPQNPGEKKLAYIMGNKLPSRIDLGWRKYSCYYIHGLEDVESVKTFLNIVAVLLSTFGFFIPYYHALIGVLTYGNSFEEQHLLLMDMALWQAFESDYLVDTSLIVGHYSIVP